MQIFQHEHSLLSYNTADLYGCDAKKFQKRKDKSEICAEHDRKIDQKRKASRFDIIPIIAKGEAHANGEVVEKLAQASANHGKGLSEHADDYKAEMEQNADTGGQHECAERNKLRVHHCLMRKERAGDQIQDHGNTDHNKAQHPHAVIG